MSKIESVKEGDMKKILKVVVLAVIIGSPIAEPCDLHQRLDLCWIEDFENSPQGGGLGDE